MKQDVNEQILKELKAIRAILEGQASRPDTPTDLFANIKGLGKQEVRQMK